MNLIEIILIRDKLQAELAVVEKFLDIARRESNGNGNDQLSIPKTPVLSPLPERRPDPAQTRLPIEQLDYGAKGKAVREAIRRCPNRYTFKDISQALIELGKPLPTKSIATVLRRMVERKEIHIFAQGKGRKATKYSK